jgi:SAM-dependent methyltransferase
MQSITLWVLKQKSVLGRSAFRHTVTRFLPIAFPFGPLRQLRPVSRDFGYRRGYPVDRYYIERFLESNRPFIRGRVLEIGDREYTERFGSAVEISDVLHVDATNPCATIVGDLSNAGHVPSDIFDCIICTQTLHLIYDFHNAIDTLHRILKPGGVLLVTVPGVSQISIDEWRHTWYWSFSTRSARLMFGRLFGENMEIGAYGNVLIASAFLHGLALCEMRQEELDYTDPQYEVIVHVKAVKEQRA